MVATDWVDGMVARRTGQVSELGKVLDPVADRLAIAAGLIALVVRGAFPVWAAALILVRDVRGPGGRRVRLLARHVRLDVRFIGKVATFCLMIAIPCDLVGQPRLPARGDRAGVWVDLLRGGHRRVLRRRPVVYVGDMRRAFAA